MDGGEMVEPVHPPEVPPYVPKPGGIGEKFTAWLLNIPVLGDILKMIFGKEARLDALAAESHPGVLAWYATYGTGEQKAAAYEHARELGLEWANKDADLATLFKGFAANPSTWLSENLPGVLDSPAAVEIAQVAGGLMYDNIMNMAIGGAGAISEELREKLRRFIGTVVLLSSAPKVMGSIAEAFSLGAIDTVGDVLRDAYFNLGLGFITWQMTSPLIDAGIGQQLRSEANMAFRPTRFSWTQIKDLYALGEIGYIETRQLLAEDGYREQDIDKIIRLAFQPLREDMLHGMTQEGVITPEACERRLRELGYGAGDVSLIMEYQAKLRTNAQRDIILATAKKARKEGVIGDSRFREIMNELNYTPEAIELELSVLMLEATEEERRLSVSQLKDAFLSNVIGEVESKTGLRTLGFRTDEIGVLIETWKRSRVPIVLRVNQQTILAALARGVLTDTEARYKLAEIGYPTDDIDLILKTAMAQGLFTRPRAPIGMLIEGARNNVISVAQLEDDLRARGYPDFDVKLISGITSFKREIPLTSDNILDAYRAGVIDVVAAGTKLIELRYSPTTATLMLETAIVEIEKGRPKVGLGLLMGLCASGLLREGDLRTILQERDYTEGDILAILAAATYKEAVGLSQSQIVNAYREGVLNRDDALRRLSVLNISPDDAQVLLQTAEKVMTVTQPRASVSAYVAATRDGILSANQLREKLIYIGFSSDDAELYVQLAIYNPAEPAKKLSKTEVIDAYKAFLFTRVDALRRLEMLGYAIEDADILLMMVRRNPEDSEIHILYRSGILTEEQAVMSFGAIGYTVDQIIVYFEHYRRVEA
jgi:hypothetical protein